jgi:hypothetical protein
MQSFFSLRHIAHYVELVIMRSVGTKTVWERLSDTKSLRIIPCCER